MCIQRRAKKLGAKVERVKTGSRKGGGNTIGVARHKSQHRVD